MGLPVLNLVINDLFIDFFNALSQQKMKWSLVSSRMVWSPSLERMLKVTLSKIDILLSFVCLCWIEISFAICRINDSDMFLYWVYLSLFYCPLIFYLSLLQLLWEASFPRLWVKMTLFGIKLSSSWATVFRLWWKTYSTPILRMKRFFFKKLRRWD